jgi:trk system potassium uptake protein TrkA
VVVVDNDQKSFNRLHPDFRGRTVEGEALSADTLERAGLDKADGIAVARVHYPQVKQVVVRNYDPAMRDMLEAFELQSISSTAWGAERVQELLIDPSFRAVFSAGNGEVEMYEMYVSDKWEGKKLSELLIGCGETIVAALTRSGRAELPSPEVTLKSGDILTISATLDGVRALRQHIQEG